MLKIYDVAQEVVRRLVPIVVELERHDPDLARQLKKARSSIPLNIGEGSQSQGARRNVHYGYAKGSAQESIAILETALSCQYIKAVPLDVIEMLRRIVGTLCNCIGRRR